MVLVLLSLLGFWHNLEARVHYPTRHAVLVERYAAEYDLPPALLYAVIRTESGFEPDAVSSAGALGLTQITPETFEWLQWKAHETLPVESLRKPEVSVRYGAMFLHILRKEFGVTETALAAYHAGRTRVNGWLSSKKYSADGRTLKNIPVPETAHYVRKVMKAYGKYRELYPMLA
jgi:soluble lytic murein transglycosylase